MRKHVKPAHLQAAIPDPTRGGDLPAEGRDVEWTVHWARLAQRGDIVVMDVDEADEAITTKKAAPKRAKAEPPAPARRAKSAGKTTRSRAAVPPTAPTGEAPNESGPVVEGSGIDAPAAPGAPEPAIT